MKNKESSDTIQNRVASTKMVKYKVSMIKVTQLLEEKKSVRVQKMSSHPESATLGPDFSSAINCVTSDKLLSFLSTIIFYTNTIFRIVLG